MTSIPKNLIISSSPSLLLGEQLSKRSIFVKVRPAPRDLGQRRAILGVLRRHGRIEVFKALGEPHSFISVAGDKATAENLILRAPLELRYGTSVQEQPLQPAPPVQPASQSSIRVSNSSNNNTNDATTSFPSSSGSRNNQTEQKFLIDIFEAGGYKHKRFASRLSVLAGPWVKGGREGSAVLPGSEDEEGLLKTAGRRCLERGYLREKGDLGWKGMTDWEGGGQTAGGLEGEDGGKIRGELRRRWEGWRGRGGIGEVGGTEGEGGKEVRARWVVTGGGETKMEGEGGRVMGERPGLERKRWDVPERSGLVLGREE
ncbi:hypothetical protein QBC40DRAFT_225015 [Triangularia verruculosa]|uniref:Uncharacterized protein n=1 Tax=Triangularia verruculosa TaxID=2587418 RepID=A0AAN6XHD6_9PEZI|nr:hypothetical protein QBC40DRAFT_225015 [Triangularia verruculosa]